MHFGAVPAKRTANISTVRTTPAEKAKLRELTKRLGFSTLAHFFRRAMETLFEQTDSGEQIQWPLRFETKKEEARGKASSKKP